MKPCSNQRSYLKSLVEEQKQACQEATVAARVAGSLMTAARLQKYLEPLSNARLGQIMLDFVWAEMDLFCPNATITAEAIHRLSGHNRRAGGRHISLDE
jgi:hypothetical protein